jgi:hypothetical protein
METDGTPQLTQHKLTVIFTVGRRQILCPAGCHDEIKALNANLFQQLLHYEVEAMVKAPDHCGISLVMFTGRLKVEDLAHAGTLLATLYVWQTEACAT